MATAIGRKVYTRVVHYEVPDAFIDQPDAALEWLYAQESFPSPTHEDVFIYQDWTLDIDEVEA